MADQTILQETLDDNIVDGDWLIYWKTSTGVQRRVARSSLLGATLTGAGTIATGGFTLTVPATGTAALKTGTPVANNVAQWDDANTVEDAGFAASDVALLGGRSGGQSLNGGTAANDDLTLQGTTNATRTTSYVNIQPNGGLVGIGTASPARLIDAKSQFGDDAIVGMEAATGQAGLRLLAGNGATNRASRIDFLNGADSTSVARWTFINDFDQDGTNDFRIIKSDGNPLLTLLQNGTVLFANLNGGTAANDDLTLQGTTNATRTTSYVNIQPNGGLVGIGTASPARLIDAKSQFGDDATVGMEAATGQAGLRLLAGSGTTNRASRIDFLNGADSPTTPRWTFINDFNQNGTNDLQIIKSDGNPLLTLLQNGTVQVAGLTSGTVYSDANGTLNNSASDARMKTDVEPIGAGDALAIVEALRPVRYRWGEEYLSSLGEQVEVGLIAQEVQAHVPEVIGTNRDGMLSLEYARLTALLVGAVQALSARVEALEAAAA